MKIITFFALPYSEKWEIGGVMTKDDLANIQGHVYTILK